LSDEEDDGFESNGSPDQLEFEDYEVLQEIGRGGQGVVYRARQKSLNRTVALKVIGVGRWATEAQLKRFRLEAEAAAGLNPLIVPIHEIRKRGGYCDFSMNFIEAASWMRWRRGSRSRVAAQPH
jgi:serine/threonine protein kinase